MDTFLAGFFTTLFLNLLVMAIGYGIALSPSAIGAVMLLGIGVFQVAYLIPLAWFNRRRPEFIKGMATVAVITCFLNGACWLIGLAILSQMTGG
ncbi:MAG: hypothetical protein AAFU71_16190 [Cyanobacteria bacterium J06632_22]